MSFITNVEDKHIKGYELEDKIHDGENVVGCFYKNTGTINLININKQYNNLKGQEIQINGLGKWYVNDIVPEQDKINATLQLFDLSYRFDDKYDSSLFHFPCKNKEWARAICSHLGLELGSLTFTNSEFVLEQQPYIPEKATYRDVMKMIAGSASSFVQIDRNNNKVYIKWFEETTVEIEDWFELTQNEESKAINTVVLGRGQVEDNIKYPTITPENPHELRIDDNQILYFNREQMIVPIFKQVSGFKYRAFTMKTAARKSLKAGMKVRYTDYDGLEVETYVMYHKLCDSGYTSNIESYELKETSTKYEYAGTIEKRLTNAEIAVNKQNNEIKAIVKEQKTTKEQINSIGSTENTAGQSIHITDGSKNYSILKINSGNSMQDQTTQSANIFNKNDVLEAIFRSGYFFICIY